MPAERTLKVKHENMDAGSQPTFSIPTANDPSSCISFAPNLTPITFTNPPPLLPAPAPTPDPSSPIFPPTDHTTTRRTGHGKKKPSNHVPRPPNAFILFRSSFIKSQHVSTDIETNHSTLSKIIGLTWQNLPPHERQIWHTKAKAALDEHRRKFPKYAFRPMHHQKGAGPPPEKRRVREVEPKDLKRCKKIADLLVEGVKGQELEAAIQEFDKHHVPEIVTRFEAPITARMYRRSSSAPIPETEHSRETFLASRSSKGRASTRQPSPALPPLVQAYESDVVDFYESAYTSPQPEAAYTFPLGSDPSFNFDEFTFDQTPTPPAPPTTATTQSFTPMYTPTPNPPPLSIDTSFINTWAPGPNPQPTSAESSMPTTPYSSSTTTTPYSHTHDPFDTFANLDQFDLKPFELDNPLTFRDPPSSSQIEANYNCSGGGGEFSTCDKPSSVAAAAAQIDMEYLAFMASLPAYSM